MRAIALWVALAMCCPSPALAQSSAQRSKAAAAQKQLSETRSRIRQLAEEQRRLEAERGAATQSLREADGKVSGSQRALQTTQQQLDAQQQELEALQAQQRELEVELARQRASLAALVRSEYALGQHQQLKLLLEQKHLGDLARARAYHRYFEQDRQKRMRVLAGQRARLAELATSIRQRQAQLVEARSRQQHALEALAAQRRERGALVSALDSRYRDRTVRLTALGRDEKNTEVLLERLRKLMARLPKVSPKPTRPGSRPGAARPGVATRPGRPANAGNRTLDAAIPVGALNLPLAGTVLAGFGGVMPDGHRSQGLLIAGNAGAEVHAVSAGRVAYADWLKGYGLLLILDHGNGLMTLYAFNDALLKNTGDSVRAGEAVSTVGSSGGQGRAALYFELRKNGKAQDPRNWLRK